VLFIIFIIFTTIFYFTYDFILITDFLFDILWTIIVYYCLYIGIYKVRVAVLFVFVYVFVLVCMN
jgi:hypothetical protein